MNLSLFQSGFNHSCFGMFPAYAKAQTGSTNISVDNTSPAAENETNADNDNGSADPSDWLNNSSFTPILGKVVFEGGKGLKDGVDSYQDDDSSDDESRAKRRKQDDGDDDSRTKRKDKSKNKKKEKKKDRKKDKKDEKRAKRDREYEEYQSRHGGGGGGDGERHRRKPSPNVKSTAVSSYKPNVNVTRPGAVFIEDMYNLKPEDAFRIDRNCDLNNVLFESLYEQNVAAYRRQVFTTIGPKSVFLGKWKKEEKASRYYSKENRAKLKLMAKKITTAGESKETVEVGVVGIGTKGSANVDTLGDLSTIPLPRDEARHASETPTNTVRSEAGNMESLGVIDAKTMLYVRGKDTSDNADLGPFNGDDEEEETRQTKTLEELVKLRVAKLNEDLTARPNDVPLWLEMIEYQEEAVPILLGAMTGSTSTSSKAKSVAKEITEKKQAILDKALLKNSSSLELQLLQFKLQRGLWDEQRWRHGWKRLLFNHANDVDLHLGYLKNFKSTVATFNLPDLLKEFCASFATLRTNKESRSVTKSTSVMTLRMEDQLTLFFLHYVSTLIQAGLVERAVASIQVQLRRVIVDHRGLSCKEK